MVVPYGEARPLLGGGEDRHYHHHADCDADDVDVDDCHADFEDCHDKYDCFAAVYKYRCNSGLEMDGPDTVILLFLHFWDPKR